MERKAKEIIPKKKSYLNSIEIDIEHIKLENSRVKEDLDLKKKLRTCCA